MPSIQNNIDLEEGLPASTLSSTPNATATPAVGFSSANATAGNDDAGRDIIEGLDLEDGLAASPPAMRNVDGSSPFTLPLAQTDNSSPANATGEEASS